MARTAAAGKVPVTERALVQRINRKLKQDWKRLCTGRNESSYLGRYYVVDTHRNTVLNFRIELETYARDLGVLQGWEALSQP